MFVTKVHAILFDEKLLAGQPLQIRPDALRASGRLANVQLITSANLRLQRYSDELPELRILQPQTSIHLEEQAAGIESRV
jgi:hypothetical protein